MYYNSKKGITEVIGFSLLTLIIVVASLAAYYFSTSQLDNTIYKLDYDSMQSNLMKLSYTLNSIITFDNSQKTYQLSFKSGQLNFKNNQILYQSQIGSSLNSTFCKTILCYKNNNNFELFYFNLTKPYNFEYNFSLIPGNYLLSFKNIKNESKIKVEILQQ